MPYDFCSRLTVKIRRLGYPRRNAKRLARFIVVQVMLIDVVLDAPGAPDVPGVTSRCLWYTSVDTGPDEFVADRFSEGTCRLGETPGIIPAHPCSGQAPVK
jgi:hypothetical protein